MLVSNKAKVAFTITSLFLVLSCGQQQTQNGLYAYNPPPAFAPVAAWKSSCSTDSMTDRTSCVVRTMRDEHDILGYHSFSIAASPGDVTLIANEPLYPKSPVEMRVDNLKYHTSDKDAMKGRMFIGSGLISEMKTGKTLSVQYYTWPDMLPFSFTVPLDGFKEAYERTFPYSLSSK